MPYDVLLDEDHAQRYYESLEGKSRRIVRDNLAKLADDPYPRPGSGPGDTEQVPYKGKEAYRLHIGRSHTAIYTVQEGKNRVLVHELLDIADAHKRYGY